MQADRRSFMLATAAAAAAGAVGTGSARAQTETAAPAAPTGQVPSAYRYKVGDLVLTAATDGVFVRPLDDKFVTNAALPDVHSALQEAFLPTESLAIPLTPLTISSGSDTILFDTGTGANGPTAGQLLANLAAAGIEPGAVTKVVISHFHGDHIGGLRDASGASRFPNAEILVPAPEWAFWMDDAQMAGAPEGMKGNFELVRKVFGGDAGQVTQFEWDKEILPGITSVDARGHTPGHTAFVLASGDARFMILSDTTNHPALFVRNPDWSVVFDMDPEQARATRHRLLDMVSADRIPVTGYHFPFPATGHIAKEGNGYDYVPVQWTPVL